MSLFKIVFMKKQIVKVWEITHIYDFCNFSCQLKSIRKHILKGKLLSKIYGTNLIFFILPREEKERKKTQKSPTQGMHIPPPFFSFFL